MTADISDLTAEEADSLGTRVEGHFLDFKAIEIAPGKLSKSLAAFANADGGDLYVGFDEDSGNFTWRGFVDVEDANAHLQTFDLVAPFGSDAGWTFLRAPGRKGLILHISVNKSRQARKASDGKLYKRLGAQNVPVVTEASVKELRRLKGLDSFEEEVTNVPLGDVANSIPMLQYLLSVVPTAEPEIYLKGQYLIQDGKPTVAAVLLFAETPQAALPKRCGIKVYRYASEDPTRDKLVGDPVTIEGHLYAQVYSAVSKTVGMITEASFLDSDGLRAVKYPQDALHEIITNAVLHRDYSVTDDIHIRIYENRIEIESPGRLPGHITTSNILSERLSRNPFIVRHLNRFPEPPNKDVGEGLDTAFESMRKLNLKNPEILERDFSVLVIIRHESLASPEQQIVDYLRVNDSIRNSVARKLVGIESESKMKKIFERLVAGGEIEHVPGTTKRGYAYRLKI